VAETVDNMTCAPEEQLY